MYLADELFPALQEVDIDEIGIDRIVEPDDGEPVFLQHIPDVLGIVFMRQEVRTHTRQEPESFEGVRIKGPQTRNVSQRILVIADEGHRFRIAPVIFGIAWDPGIMYTIPVLPEGLHLAGKETNGGRKAKQNGGLFPPGRGGRRGTGFKLVGAGRRGFRLRPGFKPKGAWYPAGASPQPGQE